MFTSSLLALLYGHLVSLSTALSSFSVRDGLFNGIQLNDGSTVWHATENVMGGLTVDLGVGNGTAQISENVYGSETITFSDPSIDTIVGRPSLFGESFTQNGAAVGEITPSFLGDGLTVSMDSGAQYVGSSDFFSGVNFTSTSPMMSPPIFETPSYFGDMSSVSSLADTTNTLDLFDGVSAIDGMDFWDFL